MVFAPMNKTSSLPQTCPSDKPMSPTLEPQQPMISTANVKRLIPDDIMPALTDTFSIIAEKLERVRGVIDRGESLAILMGKEAKSRFDPEVLATVKEKMTEQERMLFTEWEEGYLMPPFDFAKDKVQMSNGPPSKEKRYRRCAIAMAHLYRMDPERVDLANITYLHSEHSDLIPLLVAMDKVLDAADTATSTHLETDLQEAEYKMVDNMVAEYASALNRSQQQHNRLLKRYHYGMDTLISRKTMVAPSGSRAAKVMTQGMRDSKTLSQPMPGRLTGFNRPGATGRRPREPLGGVPLVPDHPHPDEPISSGSGDKGKERKDREESVESETNTRSKKPRHD